MWDNVLLAYADRSRVMPDEYRPLVIRRNGDVLPTVLVNGYVAGVWRSVDGAIEVTAFHPLPATTWRSLATEARRLASLRRLPATRGCTAATTTGGTISPPPRSAASPSFDPEAPLSTAWLRGWGSNPRQHALTVRCSAS